MADILTQLQTCLDQLATQFYATIAYLSTYHDSASADPPPDHIINDIPGGADNIMPRLAKIPRNQPSAAPTPIITGNPNNPNTTTGDQSQTQAQTQTSQSQSISQQQAQTPAPPGAAAADPAGTGTGLAVPDSPRTFAARQRELARDLIIKEQQIEYLITRLPGIDSSEAEQEGRIRELERELRGVEAERDTKARELRHLLKRLEGVMGAVQGGILGRRD